MHLRWIAFCLMTLSGVFHTAHAQAPAVCSATPPESPGGEYRDALFALGTGCRRDFSQMEQLFIAGLSDRILGSCDVPSSPADRAKLLSFITSSTLMMARRDGAIDEALRKQAASGAAILAGGKAFDAIGCGAMADTIAQNVMAYLDNSAQGGAGATFVSGCAEHYAGTYSEQQCRCVGDIGRSVIPGIHELRFDSGLISQIIEANPILGLQIVMQCGIGDY